MLGRLPSGTALAGVEVRPESTSFESGTQPSVIVKDASGQRYFFKMVSDKTLIAAEELAAEVRAMGNRPTVPIARRRIDVPGMGMVDGMIQAIVEHMGSRLPSDPMLWSLLQREVLLREHPWEWLLANLDTHADQYILVGPSSHPLNIDWDHSMVDIEVTELTRFTKRGVAIAPIRNLLYEAYAKRRLRLDFYGLRREVAKIHRIEDGALAAAVDRYGQAIGAAEAARRVLVEKMLHRKHALRRSFEVLIASMRVERSEALHGSKSVMAGARRAVTQVQDVWQNLLVTVLHDRLFRPFAKVYRMALKRKARERG